MSCVGFLGEWLMHIHLTICYLPCFSVFQFDTEFYISGLAPLCDQLVILSYVKEISEKTVIVVGLEFLCSTELPCELGLKLVMQI